MVSTGGHDTTKLDQEVLPSNFIEGNFLKNSLGITSGTPGHLLEQKNSEQHCDVLSIFEEHIRHGKQLYLPTSFIYSHFWLNTVASGIPNTTDLALLLPRLDGTQSDLDIMGNG